jgi:DNA invertase Pin-like site-specific DNA recombinase
MARTSRKARAAQAAPELREAVYDTAAYSRLSVFDSGKKDGESIINQQELLESYISERPELNLKGVFVDNGETGVDFLRPSWNDLMSECRKGRINCIVIKDLSRLGRNYIETGEYLEKILPLLGVRLIAINDGYDSLTLTNSGRLVSNLKNLVNDLYAQDISRKSSAALRIKQKQGAFIGTYASYGYLKDPADKNKIVVDPETAPVVRQIFNWKAEGVGSAQICRRLIDAGIPSPNKYRLTKGIVRDEKYAHSEWAVSVLKRILTCQVYLGHMVQGRKRGALYEGGGHGMIDEQDWTVVYNTHEPIILQELFDQAGAVIAARTEAYKAQEGKYSSYEKPEMILKDLVFCADCGRPLFRYKSVKKKYDRVYWIYQCRSHNNLMNCPTKYIHEKDLYSAVYEAIRVEIQKCSEVKRIIEKLSRESDHKSRLAKFDAEIEETERELRRVASLRQAIYDDYAAKEITVSEYQFATEKYSADTEMLRGRLELARREKEEYTQSSTPANKWIVALRRFMEDKELTSEMARAMIERVVVSDRDKVTVRFKFRDEYAAVSQYAESFQSAEVST